AADLGLLHGGENRHALELQHAELQPTRGLCHRFDQEHAGHQGIARKVSLEDGAFLRNERLDDDPLLVDVEVDDAIDHVEVFELHGSRDQALAPLAATSSSMRAHRFFSTKYCSVVALPSLTSWVHFSSGSLMPNCLSIANAMSRKSRLSMPRSSM